MELLFFTQKILPEILEIFLRIIDFESKILIIICFLIKNQSNK